MNLYQVPAAYDAWLAAVEDAGGELGPELEAELALIEGTLADRGEAACYLIRNATIEEDVYRDEARRWQEKAQRAERRRERLRKFLGTAMRACGQDHLQAGKFKVSIRRSTTPKIQWIGDPNKIPDELSRTKIEFDCAKAKEKYFSGDWDSILNYIQNTRVEFGDVMTIN